MVYTSDNPDFLVELEKKYKESIYCVYYIIKGAVHPPHIYQSVLSSNVDRAPGKPSRAIVTSSLEYLHNLNLMIAIILNKDTTLLSPDALETNNMLSPNATLTEIVQFFDLPQVTVDHAKHWGNYYWSFLHYTSIYMNIMKKNEKLYDIFYNVIFNLGIILGCARCYENYQSKLFASVSNTVSVQNTILPLSKTDAIRAIYDLHTLVNQHTNLVKYKDYTFEIFLEAYDLKIASE